MDFQVRFSGDITTLSLSDAALHSAWLSIKSPCKESRCGDKRGAHKVSKKRALGTKRKLAGTFDRNGGAELSQNKRVKQQTERETSQLGVDTKVSVSTSSAKGIDFSARTNFCSRVMAYNQGQCLDPHRYLGFFRVETNTEHQVFFSDAYQKLGQCQPTSLYDVLTTIVPVPDRKSFQYERVELAKQLAFAMLQFQNSPLLRHYWGGDDIVFFRQPESVGNVRSMLSAPYLNVQIKGSSQSSLMDIDEDDAFEGDMSDSFVKNEYLFQLATLFIEIAYQAEMEDLLSPEEARLCDDDPEQERWFVADRLCNDISSNLGSRYRAIVRLCLDCSLKDDHLVEADKYEDMICREVVNELEELKMAMVNELFG